MKTDEASKKEILHCGGSIITKNHILTAAHCVSEIEDLSQMKIVVGAQNLQDPNDPKRVERRIDSIKQHSKYQYPLAYYDVAIIVLDSPLVFGNFIHPICLPIVPINDPDHFKSESATVIGYGEDVRDDQTILRVCSLSLSYGIW